MVIKMAISMILAILTLIAIILIIYEIKMNEYDPIYLTPEMIYETILIQNKKIYKI